MTRYDPRALKRLRDAKGLTIREMARRARLTARALYALEQGVSEPKASTLARLSEVLGARVDDFFAGRRSS